MKKLALAFALGLLLSSPAMGEELPEGFYEMDAVKYAIENQVEQLREFTPMQLEVVYQASKILHFEYFGTKVNDLRIPQGEYLIGEFIQPGSYRFTLKDSDVAVIWVDRPKKTVSQYYSMRSDKNETEVILRLEEGWTLRVEYSSVYMSTMDSF